MDIPGQKQISVYAGRGILSESCGPVWMIGTGMSSNSSHRLQIFTFLPVSLYVHPLFIFPSLVLIFYKAEHHVLYQYHLENAANHYMGLIQTESVSNDFLYVLTCFNS